MLPVTRPSMMQRRLIGSLIFGMSILAIVCARPVLPPSVAIKFAEQRNGAIIQYGSFGFGGFGGAVAWIRTILDFADVVFASEQGPLKSDFQSVSDLDTNWMHPRLIAAWSLPQVPGYGAKDALPFLEDGARRFPREWLFRITWAQYTLASRELDTIKARDSATAILLPLSASASTKIPQYARNLAFTLLHKNGRPEEAMSLLLQTYEQVPDPMVRLQFRDKIGDLLQRNHVPLGADSADFLGGIGALLESKDAADHALAGRILTGLVDTAHRAETLVPARQLAGQFRSYRGRGGS